MPASQISPPPKKDGDTFDDWLFKFWTLVASAAASLSHAALSSLAWTSSKHTGTASKIAAFDGSGNATELTESGTGNVAMTTNPVFTTPNIGSATGSISGNAGTVTTNANLTGGVTSVGNATTVVTNANLTGPITSSGNATSVASQTGTGTKFVMDTSPALVTPNIGAATGISVKVTGAITSSTNSSSNGVGYATGAGGAVTQITSKSTGVSLNTMSGEITMQGAALAGGAKVTFVVTNSNVQVSDVPVVCVKSGGTADAYRANVVQIGAGGGTFDITVENITAGSLSESPKITFAIIKAATA